MEEVYKITTREAINELINLYQTLEYDSKRARAVSYAIGSLEAQDIMERLKNEEV